MLNRLMAEGISTWESMGIEWPPEDLQPQHGLPAHRLQMKISQQLNLVWGAFPLFMRSVFLFIVPDKLTNKTKLNISNCFAVEVPAIQQQCCSVHNHHCESIKNMWLWLVNKWSRKQSITSLCFGNDPFLNSHGFIYSSSFPQIEVKSSKTSSCTRD